MIDRSALVGTLAAIAVACGGSEGDTEGRPVTGAEGGSSNSGGTSGSGGESTSGGTSGSGASGNGGASGTGGESTSGGASGSGSAPASGGASGTGGESTSGGASGSGGESTSGGSAGAPSTGGVGGMPSTGGAGSGGSLADTWDNFASAFFASYCVSCHDADDSGDMMRDYTSRSVVASEAPKILCGVATAATYASRGCSGFPPPAQFPIGDGAKPSDAERERLVIWIDAGMP